jgi:hypothetical protein
LAIPALGSHSHAARGVRPINGNHRGPARPPRPSDTAHALRQAPTDAVTLLRPSDTESRPRGNRRNEL